MRVPLFLLVRNRQAMRNEIALSTIQRVASLIPRFIPSFPTEHHKPFDLKATNSCELVNLLCSFLSCFLSFFLRLCAGLVWLCMASDSLLFDVYLAPFPVHPGWREQSSWTSSTRASRPSRKWRTPSRRTARPFFVFVFCFAGIRMPTKMGRGPRRKRGFGGEWVSKQVRFQWEFQGYQEEVIFTMVQAMWAVAPK